MEKITSVEQGVARLLRFRKRQASEYTRIPAADGDYLETLYWNGKRIPLFTAFYDPQLRAISRYDQDPKNLSAWNVYSFCGKDVSLRELIFREASIAEFVLHSRIVQVAAFVNTDAANMILTMQSGACANMDLGCTMAPGTSNQCQHRLITNHGMASDLNCPEVIPQHTVHVFGQESQNFIWYEDMEAYLYGLDEEQCRTALTIHAIITGQEPCCDWLQRYERCRKVVDAVIQSSQLCKPVKV